MHKKFLGALLYGSLIPLVGMGRLIWHALTALATLRPSVLLMGVGLLVALSLPNPISAWLAASGVWPLGHMMLARGLPLLAVGVLYHGLRSPALGRIRRRLLR